MSAYTSSSYVSTNLSVSVTSPITALSSSCLLNKSKNFCSVPFSTTNSILSCVSESIISYGEIPGSLVGT